MVSMGFSLYFLKFRRCATLEVHGDKYLEWRADVLKASRLTIIFGVF